MSSILLPCLLSARLACLSHSKVRLLDDNTTRQEYQLDPQLLMNLSLTREKRRLVHFSEIPPSLVHAVTSVEDKRFFHHWGFDYRRIFKAAYIDLKDGRKQQGASTLTMQLARALWLDPGKGWRRKIEELLITFHLEQKLTKQQFFEDYANEIYLDLNLEGTRSALPIWAEFMKRAAQFRPYRSAREFQPPGGVVSAEVCNTSGELAGSNCPDVHTEVFIRRHGTNFSV
jgi:membrane carboxypeptidase/penicillin-binding protein